MLWRSSIVLSAALAVTLVMGGCGDTGGGTLRPTAAGAPDTPAVQIGGYTFGTHSNVLTHPYWTVNAQTAPMQLYGYGEAKGTKVVFSFTGGGLVKGAKTLRLSLGVNNYRWLAQDTQGNVHMLKIQEPGAPAHLYGVAAGDHANFWCPRMSVLTPGYVWYSWWEGARISQHRVMSLTASFRGRSNLGWIRHVDDSNHDGHFDPNWSGPDSRNDVYADTTIGMYAMQVGPTTGYMRRL